MLVTWRKRDGLVRCRDHGVIGEGKSQAESAAGVVMLEHLRDVHGADVDSALAKARVHASREG